MERYSGISLVSQEKMGTMVWGLWEYLAQTGQPYTLTSQAHFVTEDQWSGVNNELQNIERRMTKEGVAAGLPRHFVQ
jgi:hypothetical protein